MATERRFTGLRHKMMPIWKIRRYIFYLGDAFLEMMARLAATAGRIIPTDISRFAYAIQWMIRLRCHRRADQYKCGVQ